MISAFFPIGAMRREAILDLRLQGKIAGRAPGGLAPYLDGLRKAGLPA